MMTPSTVFTVFFVASLFITDDVHSKPVPSTESPFQILDCGIEGLICVTDSDCCEGFICSKDDKVEEGFCSPGLETRRNKSDSNGLQPTSLQGRKDASSMQSGKDSSGMQGGKDGSGMQDGKGGSGMHDGKGGSSMQGDGKGSKGSGSNLQGGSIGKPLKAFLKLIVQKIDLHSIG